MIAADIRDQAEVGVDDIDGVQATAQAHFQQGEI